MTDADIESKALAGDVEAQCSMAFLHEIGLDRPQNYQKAAFFWQMAAKAGKQLAIDKLKQLVESGRIPATFLEAAGPKPTPSSGDFKPTPGSLPKILLADDEEELRGLMVEYLENSGFRVVLASNGEDAVQKVLANPDIKVIVTDLKMPKLNGLQFINTLRRMQLAAEARIVVMTAYSQPQVIAEGKRLAVDTWLVKPIKPSVMIETIKKHLQQPRKNQVA